MKLDKELTQLSEARVAEGKPNVIENVHVCGLISKNGYTYSEAALKEAIPLYEGKSSYLNHNYNRKVEDKFGVLSGITYKEGSGLWAKAFTVNPKHPAFESVMWWAKTYPDKLGLSHVAEGVKDNEKRVVIKIDGVEAVDLVADPATVGGLHESKDFTIDMLIELVESLKANGEKPPTTTQPKEEEMDYTKLTIPLLTEHAPQLVKTIQEAAAKTAAENEKKLQVALHALPESARTPIFEKQLRSAANDEDFKALIEDRKTVTASPISAPGRTATEDKDKNKETVTESTIKNADDVRKLF